jgi:hypothetical protein
VVYRRSGDTTPKAALDFINSMREAVKTQRFSLDAPGHL